MDARVKDILTSCNVEVWVLLNGHVRTLAGTPVVKASSHHLRFDVGTEWTKISPLRKDGDFAAFTRSILDKRGRSSCHFPCFER